jgi:hypothetical protein
MTKLDKNLLIFTAFGIFIYWTMVFLNIFPVNDIIPGYKNWFMAFPLADLWIALISLLSIILEKKNPIRSALFKAVSGSSLIFLGLYALLYGIRTKLLFNLTPDELIEIGIKLYCLIVGTRFIFSSLKDLEHGK